MTAFYLSALQKSILSPFNICILLHHMTRWAVLKAALQTVSHNHPQQSMGKLKKFRFKLVIYYAASACSCMWALNESWLLGKELVCKALLWEKSVFSWFKATLRYTVLKVFIKTSFTYSCTLHWEMWNPFPFPFMKRSGAGGAGGNWLALQLSW